MIKSEESSAGLLHKITKRAQILKKEEEDARLLDHCEERRKEWAKHWQCDESTQKLEDKLWENEELRKAMPRPKECHLEKVSRIFLATTGVGCDGFHPKVPLDLTKETMGEIVEFLEKVEQSGKWPQQRQSGKWPQQACTTRFLLIPKSIYE